jgi:hypothetical protein
MPAPVVILIFSHKPALEWYEQVSLQQCVKVLGRHPMRLVCPVGMDVAAYRRIAPGLEADFIPSHWMASYRAYNRMKTLPFLYRRYAAYEFILSYELDAFVFRDELLHWCEQGWDYIGAPWFDGYERANEASSPLGVGNGGFSLRRVQAALRVTRSCQLIHPFCEVFREWRQVESRSWRRYWWLLRNLTTRNCFHHWFNRYADNEDLVWSAAGARVPGFKVAPWCVGAEFSFEVNARRLYRDIGRLPFGCHKWMGIQPDFWRPFIEAEGYRWPSSN